MTGLRIASFDQGVDAAEKFLYIRQIVLLTGNLSFDITDITEGRLSFSVASDNVKLKLVVLNFQGLEAVLSTPDVNLALFEWRRLYA